MKETSLGHREYKELTCQTLIVISSSFSLVPFPLIHLYFFFYFLQLLHPYIGGEDSFDVIINWRNSEHHGMDEGDFPSARNSFHLAEKFSTLENNRKDYFEV